MDMERMNCYTIDSSRWKRSLIKGGRQMEGGLLFVDREESSCHIFFPPLPGLKTGEQWGRIHIEAEFPKRAVWRVWAAAYDRPPGEAPPPFTKFKSIEERSAYFKDYCIPVGTNCRDALLFDVKGRFLWIYIEIENGGGGMLRKVQVLCPGDNFLSSFPEVYRLPGSFFHRYLTIFSTIYDRVQKEIDRCSMEETVLKMMEGQKEAAGELGWLRGRKGTRKAVLKATEILGYKDAVLAEQETNGILFIPEVWEEEKDRNLNLLLNQFLPAGFSLRIIYEGTPCRMDDTAYLGLGMKIADIPEGRLNTGFREGMCMLGAK